MKIKAGIFDVGGVLVNKASNYIWEDVRKTLSLTEKEFAEFKKGTVNIQKGNVSEEIFLEKYNAPKDLLYREYKKHFKTNEDSIEVLKALKKYNITLAALTNTIKSHIKNTDRKQVFKHFHLKILSYDTGFAKPEEEIYKLALKKLGVKPQEAFFVDDKEENVEAANKLGIHGILFKNAQQLRKDLRKLALIV